jgi:hypothetical protein
MLVFARNFFEENIQKGLMFCPPLSDRCTERDIFKTVNDNFTPEGIFWDRASTSGQKSSNFDRTQERLQSEVQQNCPHVNFVHCIIDGKTLVSPDFEQKLHSLQQESLKSSTS